MTIVQLEDRAVLLVAGADATAFLQGLLTHDMALLAADRPLYAGLLSPQGKALFDMILFDAGEAGGVLIDVAADRADALARRLSMYKLRKAVTITPSALAVYAGWDGGEAGHAADPRLAALGARWVAAPGAAPSGGAAYDEHRLRVGVPGSADIGSDELLWLETGADLLNGVSFTKGCYIGQENTARMHHRDRVRRRLVPVRLASDDVGADVGDGVVRDAQARSVGTLRSAGRSNELGFAHLRMEAATGPLTVGDTALTVAVPAWLEPEFTEIIKPGA